MGDTRLDMQQERHGDGNFTYRRTIRAVLESDIIVPSQFLIASEQNRSSQPERLMFSSMEMLSQHSEVCARRYRRQRRLLKETEEWMAF